MVPKVGLLCFIVAFSCHIHLPFGLGLRLCFFVFIQFYSDSLKSENILAKQVLVTHFKTNMPVYKLCPSPRALSASLPLSN